MRERVARTCRSASRSLRRRLTLLLAVVGPGLITSNVDNDAGGISTYTAGRRAVTVTRCCGRSSP